MPQLGQTLERAWDSLLNGFAYVAGLLVVTVTFSVLYEVVARYFFNNPTIWAVDLTEYSLVYITMLGAPWVLRDRAHTRVEIVVERLRPRVRRILGILVPLVAVVGAVVLAWEGAWETWDSYRGGHAELKAWRVPRWPLILPIFIGGVLLVIEFLRQAWQNFGAFRRGEPMADEPGPVGQDSL